MSTLLNAPAAYELWADTYPAEAHNPLMAAEQAVVARIVSHLRPRRALDVGTGSGRYLPILSETGAFTAGVDLSMPMLRRGNAPGRICADAFRLPFKRSGFDLVNASLVAGDVQDLKGWNLEMARVLSIGGHLVYSDFHPTWSERGWRRTFRSADGVLHAVRFEPHTIEDHLDALIAAGFDVLAIREPRLSIGGVNVPVVAIFHAVKNNCALKIAADRGAVR
jgi:malonyl-CoA O-methyltransferase